MKPCLVLFLSCLILTAAAEVIAQGPINPGNKIRLDFRVLVEYRAETGEFHYQYVISNRTSSAQSLSQFWVLAPNSPHVTQIQNVAHWFKVDVNQNKDTTWIQWGADSAAAVRPGQSEGDFSFWSNSRPGIVTYYAEGWTPEPDVDEGQLDSLGRIPGYNDLTPYGGGIVGKTVGPLPISTGSQVGDFLDTLISYKHQSVALGWLRDDNTRKRDCEEVMKGRDWYRKGEFGKFRSWEPDESWDFDHDWNNGIVGVLDRRLDKARRELTRGDSVGARRDLEIFAMEVELVKELGKKTEMRNKKSVLTSEGYALLKYNAEYLIDRLPERHGRGEETRGKK